ncbi:hypothetical protein JVU11DRAFT_120 [Chiua virens]|nr:hypothetical protein JVU11DRAFT_120 [Chiua virens]
MSSKLQPYTTPSAVRSSLFKNQSEAVPPVDELDLLHSELQLLRQKSLERAKKAGDDIKTIEESMRRAKEKVKGKAKAMERVNRERGFTPLVDADEQNYGAATINGTVKARAPSSQISALSSVKASQDPRRPLPADFKKKKKRKREDDSDLEGGVSMILMIEVLNEPTNLTDTGKATKTVPQTHAPSALPPKPKVVGSTSNHAKASPPCPWLGAALTEQ